MQMYLRMTAFAVVGSGEICDAAGASQAAGFGARVRGTEGAGSFVAKGTGGMEAPH